MQPRIEKRRSQAPRWLLYPLIAVSACALAALASAGAPAPAPERMGYRIVPVSASGSNAFLNAKGQVAFSEEVDGTVRARFFDGNTVRDIGTLGGPRAEVSGLNDLGQVTGASSVDAAGTVSHAYRWSRTTGMIDLAGPGQGNSSGAAINNKGQVTGVADFDAEGPALSHAFLWSPSTGMLDLGRADGFAIGLALNEAGTVVGFGGPIEGGRFLQEAFRWTPAGGYQGLGTIPSEFTFASDVNNAGQIVGATPFSPDTLAHAFLWTPQAGLIDLAAGRSDRSLATRINEKGLVIGDLIDFPLTFHGFIWSRDMGLIEIGQGQPDIVTSALGLNNRGQVVGTIAGRAYVWTRATGFVDLNTLVPRAPAGLVLVEGIDINDSGTILARANTGLVLLVPHAAPSHSAPVAGPIKITGNARVNVPLAFSATFRDADPRDTHTATWTWGDGSRNTGAVSGRNGAGGIEGNVSGQHAYRKAGIYTVKLTITDSAGKSTTVQRRVVICANGAALAGEGSFMSLPGATTSAPTLSGLASFAFVSEGTPGGSRARNAAAIVFEAPGVRLRSDAEVEVLATATRVQYRGSGTVDGKGKVQFLLTASDGAGARKDRIRMRIWQHAPGSKAETLIYDNGAGSGEGAALIDGEVKTGAQ
jgi:probable HAF family extracellular repeat protein